MNITTDGTGPDEDRVQAAFDKIMALKDDLEGRVFNSLTPEQVLVCVAASIYGKAFLETLAKRHADGIADLVRKRFRKNGKTPEVHIGVDNGEAATIVVTGDLPDEARLALLDLDVTSEELRGKLLCWDSATSAWLSVQGEGVD